MRKMILSLIGVSALASFDCAALTSGEARGKKHACEKGDGYMRYLSGGPEIKKAIDDINAARLAAYKEKAGNLPVSSVADAAGKDLISRYPESRCP